MNTPHTATIGALGFHSPGYLDLIKITNKEVSTLTQVTIRVTAVGSTWKKLPRTIQVAAGGYQEYMYIQ